MRNINEYNGYKVVCGKQFPTYRSTWDQAKACAMQFTHDTKTDSIIYGIDEMSQCHYLMGITARKPRT